MSYKAKRTLYLYDPTHKYSGLPADCIENKQLNIIYLKRYLAAIMSDNFWREKHYCKKLLTSIRYNDFSTQIVDKLHRIFRLRAEFCAHYWLLFCYDIKHDETLTLEEKNYYLNNSLYGFEINDQQQYPYYHSIKDDLGSLFYVYKNNGFASSEVIDIYQECRYLFRYSHMEEDMMLVFDDLEIDAIYQKEFDDLISPFGKKLRFDGYILKDGKPLLFECQGLQHYKPIKFFGGEEAFERILLYDKIKESYCIEHRIPLLCIKYDQNVRVCITKFLNRKSYPNIIYKPADSKR